MKYYIILLLIITAAFAQQQNYQPSSHQKTTNYASTFNVNRFVLSPQYMTNRLSHLLQMEQRKYSGIRSCAGVLYAVGGFGTLLLIGGSRKNKEKVVAAGSVFTGLGFGIGFTFSIYTLPILRNRIINLKYQDHQINGQVDN